jgi:hypothetical protein
MAHDIEHLEKRIKAFDEKMVALGNLSSLMNSIIHRQGWTTLAEYNLVLVAMGALEQHAESISFLRDSLVRAADSINVLPGNVTHGGPGPRL